MVALRTEEETNGRRRKEPRRSRTHLRLVELEPVISIYRPYGIQPGDVLPLVRKDSLPDKARYPDGGCELAMSCLRCPLPRCQYDEPNSVRRWLMAARDREIAVLRRRHDVPVDALARTYGLTRRSIFRILREQGRGRAVR
jgi:hypothetical protein